MTRLLLVPGSLRKDSFNARLLRHISEKMVGVCELDYLEPHHVKLPLFDQDLESCAQVVDQVAAVHAKFSACDGFVIASPEYNGLITAYLKNLIDWVSRMGYINPAFDNPFCDRPVLLCSASTGSSGGNVGMASARALLGYVGTVVIGDTLCLAHADKAWTDGVGYSFSSYFEDRITGATGRILTLAQDYAYRRSDVSNFGA